MFDGDLTGSATRFLLGLVLDAGDAVRAVEGGGVPVFLCAFDLISMSLN